MIDRPMLRSFANSFLIALQFLSCIPVVLKSSPQDKELGNSILFYPIVGFIIGLMLVVVATLDTVAGEQLTAALVLSFWVIITGGLHLDGFADSVDAWFGGLGSRERTLEIMKDPHIGAMGVIGLMLLLLIKFCTINTILMNQHAYCLILPPMMARVAAVLLLLITPYIRKQGIGEKLIIHMPKEKAWVVCLLTIAILILIQPFLVFSIVLSCLGLLLIWRYFMVRRLGGCTGDTVGTLIETTEALTLLILISFS